MLDFLSQWPYILNQNEEWFTLLLGARCGEMPFEMKRNEICSVVSDSLQPHGLNSPWNSPGQNTGMDSLFLLQEIFLTQGSNQVSRITGRFTRWATREAHLIWNKDDGNFNSPVYGAIAHTPHRHATWGSMTLTTITFPSASETKRFPPGWGQQCVLGAPNKEFLIRLPLAALWSQMIWGFFLPEFYTILLHFFPGKIY